MNRAIKSILTVFLTVAAIACIAFGLAACGKKGGTVNVTLISETLEQTTFSVKPGDPLPTIEIEDRDFEGYWEDAGYTARYEGTTVPEQSITLYYKAAFQYYTLNLDYGSYGVRSFEMRRGVNEKLPELAPEGCSALGFSDTDTGDAIYLLGDSVKNLAPKGGEVTLYARYEREDVDDYTIENDTVISYNGRSSELCLPLSARKVATGAFLNNVNSNKVVSLTVPATYVEIACGAFEGLTSLESLTVPFVGGSRISNRFLAYTFGAETYQDNTFSFSAYTDGSSLYLGDEHYENQLLPLTLTTVRITESTKEFAEGAFYSAYALENVLLDYPQDLDKIGKSAFENCVFFGRNSELGLEIRPAWLAYVSTIGDYAFKSYTGNTESSVKVIYPYGEDYPSYTAELLTYSYPFNNLTTIPKLNNVVTIGEEAFYFAVSLTDLEFGDNLKTIGARAFAYTLSISTLKFPDTLETIGDFAFAVCGALNIEFGTGIRKIGVMAFEENSNLSEVVFKGGSVPVLSGGQCFSNTLTENGSNGYNIGFDSFRIYVLSAYAEEYVTDPGWTEYIAYIHSASGNRAPAYWSLEGGAWDAKFEFTDGSIVFVTDPDQTFISEYDYWNFGEMTYGLTCGTYYPMLYEIIDGETYAAKAASGTNTGTHAKPLYENQTLVHLWHPELISYDGSMLDDLYFVISELPYNYNGGRVLLPVLEDVAISGADYGSKNTEGSYVIGNNRYGISQLYKVVRSGAVYSLEEVADPEGTYYSRLTVSDDILYTITYYDKNFEVIEEVEYVKNTDDYYSWSSPIYKKSNAYTAIQTNVYYNNGNGIFLDGNGKAKITVDDGATTYTATAVEDEEKQFGDEGYTVLFNTIKQDGVTVSGLEGRAVFCDYIGGAYSRIDLTVGDYFYSILNVTYDFGWYRYMYDYVTDVKINFPKDSNDLTDDYWRYTILSRVTVEGNITVYQVSFDDKATIEYAYYREYDENNNLVSFGTVEYGNNGAFTLKDSEGNVRTARIKDQRGSFVVTQKEIQNGVETTVDKVFTRYDDSEDMTLVLTEDFYGTPLYYYTVKTDGYGNMYILDEHDDDFYEIYLGTYDDYDSFVSGGSTYYELIFNGYKLVLNNKTPVLDGNGNPETTGEQVTMWVLYRFGSLAAWSDDEGDAQWYGVLASLYTQRDDAVLVVYDDFGYMLYEITVDIYGEANYVQYTYILDRNGNAKYTALENGNVNNFVSVTDSSGNVLYCIAFDESGNAIFSVRSSDDDPEHFRIVYDGGLYIESAAIVTVTIDYDKLEALSASGVTFGKLA